MQTQLNTTATLYCPNSDCQCPNPEFHNFCQKCRTPLLKRYLWVVGQGIENYRVGELLQDRFLLKSAKVLLDIQPSLPINAKLSISNMVEPYFKLFSHYPHIPQVYGFLHLDEEQPSQNLLLLEQAPLGQCDLPTNTDGELNIGCGVSFLIYPWREWEAFFYGQEISTVARDALNYRAPQLNSKLFKRVEFGSAQQLRYDDALFDVVIATGWSCYYPLDYWLPVIKEVKRKKGSE